MRLTVTRGAGTNLAPEELTEDLACSETPATQLGRNYLDAKGPDRMEVDVQCWPAPSDGVLLPGRTVAVDDLDVGAIWRGQVTGFSVTLAVDESGAVTLEHVYTVERPL